ncbi:MAG: carboxypeptidase-like regulatory domain-containing protein [Acidobacteriota bacterium]|nr:carboxypeptidase-like regulatory domain-containing protein [Acidobacteriota bacterium]
MLCYSRAFVFKAVGFPLTPSDPAFQAVTGNITFSINGAAQSINGLANQYTGADIAPSDLSLFNNTFPAIPANSTVVLSAGTVITVNNVNGTLPTPAPNDTYETFLTDDRGSKCSIGAVGSGATAASVSVSGRVVTSGRRGLSNALVYLTDSQGITRSARTTSFGYYRFEDVQAGQTITLTVVSKRYQFAPQVLNLNEEITELNFAPEP